MGSKWGACFALVVATGCTGPNPDYLESATIDGAAFPFATDLGPCGSAGEPCCGENRCAQGGCCVSGRCVANGGSCGATKCIGGSCGAGTCGGLGQPCCGAAPALCTAPGAVCATERCRTCGGKDEPCCIDWAQNVALGCAPPLQPSGVTEQDGHVTGTCTCR